MWGGVLKILFLLAGMAIGFLVCIVMKNELLFRAEKSLDKIRRVYYVTDKMLAVAEQGKTIADWLKEQGYRSIAVYGMGKLGEHLINELEAADTPVQYAIDRREIKGMKIPVYSVGAAVPEADILIVTAIVNEKELYQILPEEAFGTIIPLEQILTQLLA